MNEFENIGNSLLDNYSNIITRNFVWVSVPFTMVIAWIFMLIERVGDTSENPFDGGMNNGVPITTISRGIEIDIREMINDNKEDIPKPYPQSRDSQM